MYVICQVAPTEQCDKFEDLCIIMRSALKFRLLATTALVLALRLLVVGLSASGGGDVLLRPVPVAAAEAPAPAPPEPQPPPVHRAATAPVRAAAHASAPSPPPSSQAPSAVPAELHNCSRIRSGRLLLYAAHSGFGNQEMSLRKALLLAYVLNRTLLLPPVLAQSDLSFGPPEQRCTNRTHLDGLQRRAEAVYERRRLGGVGGVGAGAGAGGGEYSYESLLRVYDFGELSKLGVRVQDYAAHMRRREALATAATLATGGGATTAATVATAAADVVASAPLSPLLCGRGERLTVPAVRAQLRDLHAVPLLRVGSVYFAKLDFVGLQRSDRCFSQLVAATLRLPHAPPVLRAARAAVRRLRPPWASLHLRRSDDGSWGEDEEEEEVAAAAAVAARLLPLAAVETLAVPSPVAPTPTQAAAAVTRWRWVLHGCAGGCRSGCRAAAASSSPQTSPTAHGRPASRPSAPPLLRTPRGPRAVAAMAQGSTARTCRLSAPRRRPRGARCWAEAT